MADKYENKITVLFESLLKKIAEERGGDLTDCNITELDFSGPIFELESLEGLKYISWRTLKALDASNNSIDKIGHELSRFQTLQTIIATNNLITKIEFSLPNLLELDLSRNYLKHIPDLSGVPRLERLLLSFNEISGGFNDLTPLSNLLILDLSNNKISLIPSEIKRLIETLKNLIRLNNLKVYNNPFCEEMQEYEYYFIYAIKSITSFNNEAITSEKRARVTKLRLKSLEQVFKDASANAKQALGKIERANLEQIPKLEDLHYNMQLAKNSPMDCLDKFKIVARDVEKILNKPEDRFLIFKANTPEEQSAIRMHIDSFLQEAVMMIEDMPTMRTPVLRLLASLSEVEEGSFGKKCMLTLQDLFVSGPEISMEIKDILRKIIIPKIRQNKVDDISKDLLRGVIKLCKDHHQDNDITEILEDLIDIMAEWIRAEVTSEELRIVQGELKEDLKRETHTYMLELVACAADSQKNAELMNKKKIGSFVAKLIKIMERETEPSNILNKQEGIRDVVKRLKFILKIIENMTKNSSASTVVFIKEEIHQKILREIWGYLMFYKANGYTFSTGTGATESNEIMYYKLLSSIMNTLTGLCRDKKCVEYMNTTGKEIRDEILNVSVMPKIDPLLLTSIIELVHALLSSEYFLRPENTAVFGLYVRKLQKMLPFMPYLGGKKYKDICLLGEKYAKGTIVGQEAIPINSLSNKYLHRLFIAIIDLVKFFSNKLMETTIPEISELCTSISTTLNANDREELLFNCLEVQNDSVRLAVVQCLDKIPVEEIDIEETGHIVRILESYKNLGVGRTEEVLSQIFILITKILENGEKGEEFRNKFGEMVITECLNILYRNQERDLTLFKDENYEKIMLTASGVFFLKNCSKYENLHSYMENLKAEENMRKILKCEEKYSTYNEIPVDIERTWIGTNIEALLINFTSSDHLFPYNEVSYRIIQRIANVLNNSPEEEIYVIPRSSDEHVKNLLSFIEEKKKQRDQQENSAWPSKMQNDESKISNFNTQHNKFSQMKGVTLILNFLLGRSSMRLIEIEKKLSKEFDTTYDKQELLKSMNIKVQELTSEFTEQCKKAEDNENNPKTFIEIDDTESDLLIRAMQEQDLNIEENSYAMGNEIKELDDFQYDKPEYKLRAKILACFLRCIISALEIGPAKCRSDTIAELQDFKNLKFLTKLCASTGWKHSTLGAKYLRVIKHIIIFSPITNFRPAEEIILFEVLALALIQILEIIKIKVTNWERVALNKEDHFLIDEASSVGASLCKSVYTFSWSRKVEGIYMERTSVLIKSVQEQAAAYILEQLIPLNSVRSYIEILFYDMTTRERMVRQSYSKPLEDILYMEKARESIGDILATYIALNENAKYRVLEYCKMGTIFNDKIFNATYLQDIMNKGNMTLFSIELSKYMKKNYIAFHMKQGITPELISNISWGDMVESGSNKMQKILFLITSRCIYLLNPCTSPPCPLCGEERFCPEPPSYRTHILFENLTKIVTFYGTNQIIGIHYEIETQKKSFIFITKAFNGGEEIVLTLTKVKEEISGKYEERTEEILTPDPKQLKPYINSDVGFRDSLEGILNKKKYGNIVFCVYCSLNPKSSIGIIEGLKVFKRGAFCVLTDKNLIIAFDLNFKNWVHISDFEEEEEKKTVVRTSKDLNQDIFSLRNEFDLGKSTGASIKDEAECKFYLKIDNTENILLFGDDYGLEIFQRHLMTRLYTLKGGDKVQPRLKKGKNN